MLLILYMVLLEMSPVWIGAIASLGTGLVLFILGKLFDSKKDEIVQLKTDINRLHDDLKDACEEITELRDLIASNVETRQTQFGITNSSILKLELRMTEKHQNLELLVRDLKNALIK